LESLIQKTILQNLAKNIFSNKNTNSCNDNRSDEFNTDSFNNQNRIIKYNFKHFNNNIPYKINDNNNSYESIFGENLITEKINNNIANLYNPQIT